MISIDTNLLVRFFTNDDIKQARFAAKLLEKNLIFISKSVLLETEWVLRYTYEFDRDKIHEAFEKLLGLPQITIEDPACVIKLMQWYGQGFDFADAMHLASSMHMTDLFATLDRDFIKQAKKININLITM